MQEPDAVERLIAVAQLVLALLLILQDPAFPDVAEFHPADVHPVQETP